MHVATLHCGAFVEGVSSGLYPSAKPPMTPPPSKPALRHLRASDLRAAAQLVTQATRGVADIAEGVHRSVQRSMGLPGGAKGQTAGLTGLIYRSVHGVTALVGKGLEAAFTRLEPLLGTLVQQPSESPEREAVLAALNGVMGDRLQQSDNPLATTMQLRYQGTVLDLGAAPLVLPQASGKLALLIHGLCMNDLQWANPPTRQAAPWSDHGSALAGELGYSVVYLRYNSGLHVSDNGAQLASLLEQLVAHWPVPLQDLTIVAHSMGGLVARSALDCAVRCALHWPRHLKHLVFLGTPHHGAPLERAGNWIDVLLGGTPYSRPFARLGQLRSAGITDLRFGFVRATDWQGRDRFRRGADPRQPLPLPVGVACFAAAATSASRRSPVAERILGDGLVPLPSALGQHAQPQHCLAFAPSAQWIGYGMNHWDLLRRAEVIRQVLLWLTPPGTPPP